MELRQLEYFVAVAGELSFTRAAQALHVAQPSVSQQIRALEVELGVALFVRGGKTVALTSAGGELLPLASRLLADSEHLRQVADMASRRVDGRLRIGFLGDEFAHPRVDRLLIAMRGRQPRLVLEFRQVDFAEQHRALEDGDVDIAFVMAPIPGTILMVELLEWPRLVAVNALAAADHSGDLAEWIARQPVALPNQMASEAWRRSWTPAAGAPGHVFVVGEDSMEGMLAIVGAGRGVCVVPGYVRRYYPHPGVTYTGLASPGPGAVGLGAARARLEEPHIRAAIQVAESVGRETA